MHTGITGTLKVAPIAEGCCITIEGRGTLKLSHECQEIATRVLAGSPQSQVVIDLTDCTYLDSTFLGSLLIIYRQVSDADPPRFHIAAPPPTRQALLGMIKLDRIIHCMDTPPTPTGRQIEVQTGDGNLRRVAEHVMTCHRCLSQLPTPMAQTFAHIADQMQEELETIG